MFKPKVGIKILNYSRGEITSNHDGSEWQVGRKRRVFPIPIMCGNGFHMSPTLYAAEGWTHVGLSNVVAICKASAFCATGGYMSKSSHVWMKIEHAWALSYEEFLTVRNEAGHLKPHELYGYLSKSKFKKL